MQGGAISRNSSFPRNVFAFVRDVKTLLSRRVIAGRKKTESFYFFISYLLFSFFFLFFFFSFLSFLMESRGRGIISREMFQRRAEKRSGKNGKDRTSTIQGDLINN